MLYFLIKKKHYIKYIPLFLIVFFISLASTIFPPTGYAMTFSFVPIICIVFWLLLIGKNFGVFQLLFVGIFTRSVLHMEDRIKFLGKAELFKIPVFGYILKKLGGYPVIRNKQNNSVDSVVNIFKENNKFFLALAPEGTREKVNKLKTGFYYIALKAKVPIVLVGFDFRRRIVDFGEKFYPSGNIDVDMKKILIYFGQFYGRFPEKGLNHMV